MDKLIILILCSITYIDADLCHRGWIHHGESCYLFPRSELDWFSAASSCREHNSVLAEVDSKEEGEFLRSLALNATVSVWLGARDDIIEGEWEWSSGRLLAGSYTDWAPGEPNGNEHHNCLKMIYGALDDHWDDDDCKITSRFICETEANDQSIIIGK